MNLFKLEEAHKSGRMFRKKGSQDWLTLKDVSNLSGEDAFAKIWELKSKETFTLLEVEQLMRKSIRRASNSPGPIDSLRRTEMVQEILNEY